MYLLFSFFFQLSMCRFTSHKSQNKKFIYCIVKVGFYVRTASKGLVNFLELYPGFGFSGLVACMLQYSKQSHFFTFHYVVMNVKYRFFFFSIVSCYHSSLYSCASNTYKCPEFNYSLKFICRLLDNYSKKKKEKKICIEIKKKYKNAKSPFKDYL